MFEVIGQDKLKEIFNRMYDEGKVVNSYILKGPKGIGKKNFALYMAAKILCENNLACGKCRACVKIKHGNHPDVIILSKDEKSIGVEDIEEIIEKIQIKPYEGDKKVVIIENFENATIQAQNKFLKTLEEPVKNTIIILTANNFNTILETIISRCQIFTLNRADALEIEKYLIKKGVDSIKAKIFAKLSDGIVGSCKKFLDEDYIKLRQQVIDIAKKIHKIEGLEILDLVKFFNENKESIEDILEQMIIWYRDILIYKLTYNKDMIINEDYFEDIIEESKILSYNKLNGIINIIKKTKQNLEYNINFQLSIEAMLLNIQEV
ncbi:DNA polymerase-3 subunit delta' [Caloramator fervidus]|uniref:DNA polymerase III subunit delta' n=1 Tax=Caloramator fervidus TaxID=29344 RepID=A0A1H5XQM8_9CLOT|nr:DNA polymerase III subunit delta' C-terminal domain-containing protein [Caloramator fervidus]SEG13972.1 DNA polymerase-3 subunit delta' [Caloramator fervidus]